MVAKLEFLLFLVRAVGAPPGKAAEGVCLRCESKYSRLTAIGAQVPVLALARKPWSERGFRALLLGA
jgi:hypothetical protein